MTELYCSKCGNTERIAKKQRMPVEITGISYVKPPWYEWIIDHKTLETSCPLCRRTDWSIATSDDAGQFCRMKCENNMWSYGTLVEMRDGNYLCRASDGVWLYHYCEVIRKPTT